MIITGSSRSLHVHTQSHWPVSFRVGVLVLQVVVALGLVHHRSQADTTPPVTEQAAAVAAPLEPAVTAPEPVAAVVPEPENAEPASPPSDAGLMHQRLAAEVMSTRTCLVVKDGPDTVVAHDADAPYVPASTLKVVVAAAALSALGPDYRFETKVVAPRPPEGGAVEALWLVGGGDPVLASPAYIQYRAAVGRWRDVPSTHLTSLADQLKINGIRQVSGSIHADDSRHETARYVASWRSGSLRSIGPLGALTVDSSWMNWGARVPALDPAHHTAGQLAGMLGERGVPVLGGPARTVPAPVDGIVLAREHSPPLSAIVTGMLRSSDNLIAEQLVREVGLIRTGSGTTSAGTRAVEAELRRLGVDVGPLRMQDGSGLDRGNVVSCRMLTNVLELGLRPGFESLWDGLAVAGHNGTLAGRMGGTPLQGRVRGKTGTIREVIGLTGVLDVGRPIRYAVIQNDAANQGAARARHDRILGILYDHLR